MCSTTAPKQMWQLIWIQSDIPCPICESAEAPKFRPEASSLFLRGIYQKCRSEQFSAQLAISTKSRIAKRLRFQSVIFIWNVSQFFSSTYPGLPLAMLWRWNLWHPSFSQHLHEQKYFRQKTLHNFWFHLSLFCTALKMLSQSRESHDRQPMEGASVIRKYEPYGVDAFDLSFSPASIPWRLQSPSAHLAL